MPGLSDAQLDALTRRHIRLSAAVRQRVLEYLTRAWGSLDGHRTADIDRFVRMVVPIVEAGQVQVAALTDGYLTTLERAALGTATRPVGAPQGAVTGLRGVPAGEVYQRAGVTVWTALSRGVPYADAVAQGLNRARDLAATDLQLAETHTARRVMARNNRIVGYRRALSGGDSCALCAVAATQRYRKERLMPIHPGCSCKVRPIYGDRDPGQIIDPDRLAGVHQRITERLGVEDRGGRTVADFRELVVTHDHGEMGPVLARKGDSFTGPSPALAKPAAAKRTQPAKPAKATQSRRPNAGDLTREQGETIAAAANRQLRGEITSQEYRRIVREIRDSIET